jgi:hypothetical protein
MGVPRISPNPNYIKLTIEGADWAGAIIPSQFSDAGGTLYMEVDYVKVWNQPQR